MQLKPEGLAAHLKRGLAPVYVISGDEPLQKDEALSAIRRAARTMGFAERLVFHADGRFDWDTIEQYADSPSLFSEKRLLEIRLAGSGPGQQGANALIRYTARSDSDQLLILATGQLDAKQRKSKWYRALESVGACLTIWPVDARNLPRWIQARVQAAGMTITREAVGILVERMEGNLVSCAQEIEKLGLLCDSPAIDVQDVLQSVVDSAHFDAFELVDSTLSGDAERTARILSGLAEEGMDPLPILGMLVWEIRELIKIAGELAGGADLDRALGGQPALRRRKQAISAALRRQGPAAWTRMLPAAGRVDQMIKGVRKGDPREALLGLALEIAGVRIPIPDAGEVSR
uniref:DNA polymerase III subunit delta n=1 Tax=Candidatus Kentrum sp. DK TaxID=2126562 RepID=A0A450S0N4_9GAMM|nr:MAG: DNA polymerase III, delta subunit [Candidatus Kentron sp. DK]VFJ66673.1 MAG: DNA polymerase III, delta subunit [Candidatus Kentron sp. DK]